jgi:endo-1,4-beta-xylanase
MKQKQLGNILLALAVVLLPCVALAQNESIIIEAESGAVGSQFAVLNDAGVQYVAIQSTIGGGNPTTGDRVITFSVTFPSAGVYELYARLRVGPATFSDDSFYYANGFGTKNPAADADWILTNNLANPVGFTLPNDKVVGGGAAQSNVWKWVKLSAYDGGEPPVAGFTVTADSLTQTFQVAGREDGLGLDKLAFGRQGVFYTVFDLDNGLPGTTVPPPPPFVPTGPPIATGQAKFLGGVSSPPQLVNFTAYWNQVTPENAGKWGSVEATRDVMNWSELDIAYALAKDNGFPFRMHNLIWGNQQPAWIEALSPAEQLGEIQQWFAAVAERYPDIDFIDVVNEPLHNPPAGAGHGNYIDALGGTGATGWDWVLASFRLARQYFPHAKLGLNEFSITNSTADMQRYIEIIQLLQAEALIDTVGVQGHAFSTRVPAATTIANLDRLATATGLPIYITELDIDGPTDDVQLADYQRIFPAFWEHPAVRGITLWGYRPGHWRTAQGAYIVLENGAERPAMVWLKDYVPSAPFRIATALVRHAPALNGSVDGSVHVQLPENITLNGSARITRDLLVPGTPAVQLNGQPTYAATLNGGGNTSPSDYSVTLNSGAALRYIVRRTDPLAFPTLTAPPSPSGTRSVFVNSPAESPSPGDFAAIRDLTLNGNAGQVAVPPGTYGTLTSNAANGGFTLGVPDATEPAVYNLQGLTLNGASTLQVVGPVVVNVATGVNVNGTMGASTNPDWLRLNIFSGGLTLNGNVIAYGVIVAPTGTVMINGTLNGRVIADRLTINGGGALNARP